MRKKKKKKKKEPGAETDAARASNEFQEDAIFAESMDLRRRRRRRRRDAIDRVGAAASGRTPASPNQKTAQHRATK